MASPQIAEKSMVHGSDKAVHADRIAERIVQPSHADDDESASLQDMVRAALLAERVAVERYRQTIALIRDEDPTTRLPHDSVLRDEEERADKLADVLED